MGGARGGAGTRAARKGPARRGSGDVTTCGPGMIPSDRGCQPGGDRWRGSGDVTTTGPGPFPGTAACPSLGDVTTSGPGRFPDLATRAGVPGGWCSALVPVSRGQPCTTPRAHHRFHPDGGTDHSPATQRTGHRRQTTGPHIADGSASSRALKIHHVCAILHLLPRQTSQNRQALGGNCKIAWAWAWAWACPKGGLAVLPIGTRPRVGRDLGTKWAL